MKLPHLQLSEDLMKAGLPEMAFAAAEYRYHDFKSPLDAPAMTLARELHAASQEARQNNKKEKFDAIYEVYKRHMNGEYDALREESTEEQEE